MPTTPRPAYIWDANSNDWAPLAGTVDTGQSYNFSAVQNFNAGVNSSIINGGSVTGKNYLINGGFDVWQRGTSSSSGMGYYTADRWYTGGTGGTITVSQETTDLPTDVPVQFGIKWVTSASSSYATLYQALESQVLKTLRGRQVTLSGYIKVTGGYAGSMYAVLEWNATNDALLSSITQIGTVAAGNAVDAATWKRFSGTFTVPANAAGLRVGLQPDLAQPSGVTVRLAGLKLELGTIATSFSTAGSTLQQEIAACQRYYERYAAQSTSNGAAVFGTGWAQSTTKAVFMISSRVQKRIVPTITFSANNDFRVYDNISSLETTSSIGLLNATSMDVHGFGNFIVEATASNLIAFRPYYLIPAGGSGVRSIEISAEL
jgi:hypothetical protein